MSAHEEVRVAVRATGVAFWIVAAITILMATLPAMERYEARLLPVVSDFRITGVDHDEDGAIVTGLLNKRRDCVFLKLTVYAGDLDDAELPRERLVLEFMDQPAHTDRSREPGLQSWGPWRIRDPQTLAGPDLFLRVTHRCHPAYDTRGIIFETALGSVFPHLAQRPSD